MQVTKGTWRMREQCVPGSLSSSPEQEPGNEASTCTKWNCSMGDMKRTWKVVRVGDKTDCSDNVYIQLTTQQTVAALTAPALSGDP